MSDVSVDGGNLACFFLRNMSILSCVGIENMLWRESSYIYVDQLDSRLIADNHISDIRRCSVILCIYKSEQSHRFCFPPPFWVTIGPLWMGFRFY